MELFAFLMMGSIALLWGKLLLQVATGPQRDGNAQHPAPEHSLPAATPEIAAEPPASTPQECSLADCASPSNVCDLTQS